MKRPLCKSCQQPTAWVRTRNFATEDAEVWECNTATCEKRGLIVCHTVTRKRCVACAEHAALMCDLALPELVVECDHAPVGVN